MCDSSAGEENYLFLKYLIWFRVNSYRIGGWGNWWPVAGGNDVSDVSDIYQTHSRTDLETFNKSHTAVTPKVSLYNLADDPEETDNLAEDLPDLVRELLAEAEEAVRDATPEVVGNMVHRDAPRGPLEGTWRQIILTLGTDHSQVIPFGPYLEDDVDIAQLEYRAGFMAMGRLQLIFLALKVFSTLLFLLLLPFVLARYFFNK